MARKIQVQILGDSSSLERAFARSSASASGFVSKIGSASKIAVTALGGLAAVGFGKAIKAAADFQTSLNVFQAVSQATAKQMGAVSAEAKQLGADVHLPATSAKDAADAMVELAKAGLSVKNTMGAARGVLMLSAAAETDNAYAAQVTANALNAFGLSGNQASHVADLLAAASVAASGEMTDMADSLTYVSASAAQSHQSIDDTVAAIGEMANKGIIGSQSGAALQQMLLRLESPTKKATAALHDLGVSVYDEHGKMLPLPSLIDQFSKATDGMSDAQRNAAMNAIFGSRAVRAANIVLLGGVDAFDKMKKAVDRQGAAQDLANAKMKGFNGAMQALESAVQTLEITIGTPFLSALSKVAFGVANIVNQIDTIAGQKGSLGSKFQALFEGAAGAINWTAVWGKATGIAAGMKAKFDSIDWSATGAAIGGGIASSVELALRSTSGLPSAFEDSFRTIDWVALGRAAGPGIAQAVASALKAALDPAFWLRNWDLLLSIALIAFGDGLLRVAGGFAAPLVRVMGDAILEAAAAIERLSPRLASLFLDGMMRLPGLASKALSQVEAVVTRVFGRLGKLAVFTLKVLGVQAVIDAIVSFAQTVKQWIDKVINWFKGLPKGVVAAIMVAGPATLLVDAGKALVGGLIDGMKSMMPDIEQKAKDLVSAAKKRLEFWKSPPDAYGRYIGELVGRGMSQGLTGSTATVVAAAGQLVAAAKAKMNEAQRDLAKEQAQVTAMQNKEQDEQNLAALKAAKTAQERADALQTIRDTAAQRELTKAQAHYTALQAAFDAAQQKMQAAEQKAQQRLQAFQQKAGTAFDRLADKIQTAFQAGADAYVSPAQQQINALLAPFDQDDLNNAITDAANAVTDAQDQLNAMVADTSGNTTPQQITEQRQSLLEAQQNYQRALVNLQVNGPGGLAEQAATQQKAHDEQVAAQQDKLNTMLQNLRDHLTNTGDTWNTAMPAILKIIQSYDGSFSDIGNLLGDSFSKSLMAAVNAAIAAARSVAQANGAKLPSVSAPPQIISEHGQGQNYTLNIANVQTTNAKEIPRMFRQMEALAA